MCITSFLSLYAIDIDTWVNMVELNLGTNQLAIIPDNIDRLQKLEVLTLSNNLLRVSPVVIRMRDCNACLELRVMLVIHYWFL